MEHDEETARALEGLTATQERVLREGSFGIIRMRFQTGEALRRMGILHRTSTYVQKLEYADADGVHLQYQWPKRYPRAHHEWTLTPLGFSVALALKQDNRRTL